jgi:hypothetical protein
MVSGERAMADAEYGAVPAPCATPVPAIPAPGIGQPPSVWRAVTWLVPSLAGLHLITAAVGLVLVVQDYRLAQRASADPGGVAASEIFALAHREHIANTMFQLVFWCYIAAYLLWFFVTRRTAERYGGDPRATTRHWTLTAWRVAVVAAALLRYNAEAPTTSSADPPRSDVVDSLLAIDRHMMLFLAARFPVAGLLVAGVWVVGRRIRALAANTVIPPRPSRTITHGLRPRPAVPSASAVDRDPRIGRTADAEFWDEVTDRVAEAGEPLPLLEIWNQGSRGGRWRLLTDEAGVAAARGLVRPGSVVTLFVQPPLVIDELSVTRLTERARRLLATDPDPASGGAVALIEEGSGVLRFDRLTVWALTETWLSRARTAVRAGLYPARPGTDVDALTASVPLS